MSDKVIDVTVQDLMGQKKIVLSDGTQKNYHIMSIDDAIIFRMKLNEAIVAAKKG